jgi:hypothetical protein
MTKPASKYYAEFRHWRRAPAERKDDVVHYHVDMHTWEFGYYDDVPNFAKCIKAGNLDVVLPCGKPLRDCTANDLAAVLAWQCAVAKAAAHNCADLKRMARDVEAQLKPSLDGARKTIVELIRSRAS